MQGNLSGLWRCRVGDYRFICRIEDDELIVLVIEISIGDIARLIANGNADLQIDLIRKMSEDYMAMRLRAHGDFVHSLARVLVSVGLKGHGVKQES